jgi:hypothetical protein
VEAGEPARELIAAQAVQHAKAILATVEQTGFFEDGQMM